MDIVGNFKIYLHLIALYSRVYNSLLVFNLDSEARVHYTLINFKGGGEGGGQAPLSYPVNTPMPIGIS